MNTVDPRKLERELAYYRFECNDLGARLLRLQEEQSQAFREARRSRTVAKLIREAYRLADGGGVVEEIGGPMLETILENTMCDGAAFLREEPAGSGQFTVTHAIGAGHEFIGGPVLISSTPNFFYTTARTRLEPPAYELTGILRLPYILWAYDRGSGLALILGNQSESNVSRPFEAGDVELVEGALSVYIDVLLRKRAEIELKLAKAAAEEASNVRAQFLATLSHELRTPLHAIIGFSELMMPGAEPEPVLGQRNEYVRQILDSGRDLLALINDILDYSSLSSSAPPLAREWLPVESLINNVLRSFAAAAASAGVTLRSDIEDSEQRVFVDRLRMRQVLNNLLSNALKFTQAGGEVCVCVSATDDGGARLTVTDNGIGMRPEDIPRALEPFVQVESELHRRFPGTGLGLPIAKGLAEAHGASFLIESALGRGTTVSIALPASSVCGRDAPG